MGFGEELRGLQSLYKYLSRKKEKEIRVGIINVEAG